MLDSGHGVAGTRLGAPGGSAIGFRGEEKLGGGLSAWFQCESSADVRGIDQDGFCTRNSAVGFKGGFGNIHFGRWDTPFKRALNVGSTGSEETGLLGMSFIAFGGSGGADLTGQAADASFNRQRWKRRETALTYYESPRFGGFQVLGAFSAGGIAAVENNAFDTQNNAKPRLWSFSGIYSAGPLGIGFGYERHNEVGGANGVPTAATTPDLDDRAWGAGASYTFGPAKVGVTYLDAKFETGIGTELKKKTATIGVEWAIAGPHNIEAQYVWVDDSKGNSATGIGGRGGHAAPIQGGVAVGGTGGDGISIAYRYNFSKRTSIKLGYVRIENDSNTNTYRNGNTASVVNGEDMSAWAFHIRHRF